MKDDNNIPENKETKIPMGDLFAPKSSRPFKFIALLEDKVMNTSINNFDPDERVGKDEFVIATDIPENLKKMWVLAIKMKNEAMKAMIDKQLDKSINTREIEKNKEMHSTLMKIFWISLRAEVNSWTRSIGIRKGWIVVEFDEKHHSQSELLRHIIGSIERGEGKLMIDGEELGDDPEDLGDAESFPSSEK